MALTNTPLSYGTVARTLHWLMALMILTAIPLGLVANALPHDTAEALARKVQVFSLHKTLGVAILTLALLRILWTLSQPRPAPVHPERRLETAAASLVHAALYLALVIVPVAGWVEHAAVEGFAPILWPFGQSLPFVPKSETLAAIAATLHRSFAWIMAGAIVLHVAGALKHALIDRDAVLGRMTRGTPAGKPQSSRHTAPALAAVALYAFAAGGAIALMPPAAPQPAREALAPVASDWRVEDGTLGLTIRQMGRAVEGRFADWTAAIRFDATPVEGVNGEVTVTIATDSLSLGSVTDQARSAEFLDTRTHPTAVFKAVIRPDAEGFVAQGTLALHGAEVPVSLPFRLTLDGDTARMEGRTRLDRRDFAVGTAYPDEASIGFGVEVGVTLTARRAR